MSTTTEKLNILNLLGEDKATKEEVGQLIKSILDSVRGIKDELEERIDSGDERLNNFYHSLTSKVNTLEDKLVRLSTDNTRNLEQSINKLSSDLDKLKSVKPKDWTPELKKLDQRIRGIKIPEPISYDEMINGLRDELKEEIKQIPRPRIGWGAHPLTIQGDGTTVDKVARVINFTGGTVTRGANGVVAVTTGGGGATSGAGAPNSTPSSLGAIYIDTTDDNAYIATGTASSADWKLIASVAP